MAKKKSRIPSIVPNLDADSKITLGIVGCFAAAGLIILSIIGEGGNFGAIIQTFTFQALGKGAVLLPVAFILAGMILIKLQRRQDLKEDLSSRLVWGMTFIIASLEGLFSIIAKVDNWNDAYKGGGVVGFFLHSQIINTFGPLGTYLILFTIFLMGIFLISNMTFVSFLNKIGESLKNPGKVMDLVPDLFEFWRKGGRTQDDMLKEDGSSISFTKKKRTTMVKEEISPTRPKDIIEKPEKIVQTTASSSKKEMKKPSFSFATNTDGVVELRKNDSPTDWKLPPFDILKKSIDIADAGDIEEKKEIIKETLSHFGIEVEMQDAIVGPTVTQYRLRPANGVRLSKIDKLQKDLTLKLAAQNIRIQAPIPGKSLVGIEVPNTVKAEVRLKDLLQTHKFINSDNLTVAVGKDVSGENILYSIHKMPHLLVAGATGSGKSVWINGLLLSLLYKYSPKELQMILVDMKRVELKLYDRVPHLLSKVITDSERAINALKWSVIEMDKRYKVLEEHGKRNIEDYNALANKKDLKKMPFIVFVIDELADLMIMAKSEVEPIIARLTQMSRAVGIHLILGTQRPDTSVITGLIKANIPTRIAFTVTSQIDSRVVLDTGGAEKLLGRGDGMMVSPSAMHPIRFQGPNVEEIEVKRCVDFLSNQLEESGSIGNIEDEVTKASETKIRIPGFEDKGNESELDETYQEAKKIVIKYQKGSASFLQQIMGIGYPKAAKIIMKLEEHGIVGPQNGSKPRDVYIKDDE